MYSYFRTSQNDKNDPFEYHFLDEQLSLFYVEDERRQTILMWVARQLFSSPTWVKWLHDYAYHINVQWWVS